MLTLFANYFSFVFFSLNPTMCNIRKRLTSSLYTAEGRQEYLWHIPSTISA